MSAAWVLMGSALALGAVHALEPGRGKTVLSVHLTGSKTQWKEAVTIGLLITALHAASVGVYGMIGVWLAKSLFNSADTLVQSAAIMAAVLIMVLGAWWTWDAWRPHGRCHHHDHDTLPSLVNFRRQVELSLASSLIPCPSAMIVVIAMLSMGGLARWTDVGLFLLLFSAGLAITLVLASSLLTIPARKMAGLFNGLDNVLPVLRKTSAVAMMLLGSFLLVKSIWFMEAADITEMNNLLKVFKP